MSNEVQISGTVIGINAINSYIIRTMTGVSVPVYSESRKNISAEINDFLNIKGELDSDTSLFVKIKKCIKTSKSV